MQEPIRKNQENKRRLLKILRKKMQQDIARGYGDVTRIRDNRIMLIEADLEHLADLDAEALAQQFRVMFSAGLASQNDDRQVPNEGEENHRQPETPSSPSAGRQERSNRCDCANEAPQGMKSMNDWSDDEGEEPPYNDGHTYSVTIDCPLCFGGPCEQALIEAAWGGTLKELLYILKTGVNANAYDTDKSVNHVLSYTNTLPRVVALLSYGANPEDSYNREYNYAMSKDRWFHLVIYYFWSKFKKNNQPSPPANIQELNNIVCSLPILEINSLTRFLENETVLEVIKDPQEKYPTNVRSFFKFLRD
ncbi:hypothetical protein [Endozoicomonas euniceicola]|uniref:Ankyrin repeat protein n=1 Tax=Endozoicomonas euniceicola TaxID=1234143 RepID=A0ABY6GTR2_9GAMM|nr:hypothetical protein [Endozoicomonas euniceicola]UYM16145.1 hypothetical protein NX720_25655 [Endozoicomonas euniceicola]